MTTSRIRQTKLSGQVSESEITITAAMYKNCRRVNRLLEQQLVISIHSATLYLTIESIGLPWQLENVSTPPVTPTMKKYNHTSAFSYQVR